jgi:hypothetical protein
VSVLAVHSCGSSVFNATDFREAQRLREKEKGKKKGVFLEALESYSSKKRGW